MYYDCVVLGGGAAGMTAAISARVRGLATVIIEHNDRVGKKILQTGNGKCNITNTKLSKDNYLCDDKEFVMEVIKQFDVLETIDFFKGMGIYPKSKNGYIYPNSEQASAVLNVLMMELEHRKVDIILEADVTEVKKTEDKFILQSNKGKIECRALIIATGSKAVPKTGSDGTGYEIARKFGHTIIKPLPALVQLKSGLKECKIMSGVRSEGNVNLYINDELKYSELGEVQYTDYGISGIPIFQISRYAVRAIEERKNVEVRIDMLPHIKKSDLFEMFNRRSEYEGYKSMEQFLVGILNKKLVLAILKISQINPNKQASEMSGNDFNIIISNIKEARFPISGYNSFENCQVCSGGVLTAELGVNMESKLIKGLYFAGEVVDVDGMCGGYNLQWAWSSGYVAGQNAVSN